MEHVVGRRASGVAVLTFCRPERLNALSRDGFAALAESLTDLAQDPAVGALVLTGEGRAFCAGAALDSLSALLGSKPETGGVSPEDMHELFDRAVNPALRALSEMPKPVITALNGIASGGGVGIALAADIVIAAPEASIHMPFVTQLGILPDAGASWVAVRALGRARALGMMLTGAKIGAQQALDWGLIWGLAPKESLLEEACALGERLAGQPREVLPWLRAAVERAPSVALAEHLEFEANANAELCGTADFAEGVSAFLGKRSPRFGRA